MMISQAPPQDIDAEKALIGSVLISAESIDDVVDIVSPDRFFYAAHQQIWRVLVKMRDDGKPFDVVVIANELRRRKILSEIGGAAYLNELMGYCGSSGNATFYAESVREQAIRRFMVGESQELAKAAFDEGVPVDEIATRAAKLAESIIDGTVENEVSMGADVAAKLLTRLDAGETTSIPTGWENLDEKLNGGFRRGGLYVFGARPSVGKSAVGVNTAVSMADAGYRVMIATLEMDEEEVVARILSHLSGVECERIISNTVAEAEKAELYQASNHLASFVLGIDDNESRTVSQLAACARRFQHHHGLDALIVDYIQLLTPVDSRVPRAQAVAEMSRDLKKLAKKLQIPVIVLAQLNRGVEMRENKSPRLSDIRDSGAIEQDADVVVFIDRPRTYDTGADESKAKFIIAKNRFNNK